MRYPMLCLMLGVAACGASEERDQAEDIDAAEQAEMTGSAEPTGAVVTPGFYSVGDDTTEYSRTRLDADGTYVDYNEGREVGGGTWTAEGAIMCFDPEGDGEEQQERCWENSPADSDGSFMTTRTDGSGSYRVTRIEE